MRFRRTVHGRMGLAVVAPCAAAAALYHFAENPLAPPTGSPTTPLLDEFAASAGRRMRMTR
jgi:hypothetical protein